MNPNPTGSSPAASRTCAGERPELLEPVGVARAVADDQQRRRVAIATLTRRAPRSGPRRPAQARPRRRPRRAATRARRELQRRHPPVVAAREHRDVHALAALERPHGQRADRRARPRATATASARRRRAARARAASAAARRSTTLQVAQREAGDRDELARERRAARRRAGSPAPVVVQASTPVASTASVALATIPNASHQPSSATRTAARPRRARTAPRSPAARRASAATTRANDRDGQQQRGVDRVRPHELPARHQRDREHEQRSSPAPCTPRARGAAASRPSRRPPGARCSLRAITVEKYGRGPSGRDRASGPARPSSSP